MKEELNILSLFDGMSCGMIAAERAGIKVGKYYASEIDKYPIKVSKANYPNIIQLGDILNWRDWPINWPTIDLLIGGSPCQGFSFAGAGLAFDDPRSKLFFVYVDILNHIRKHNPNVKFLLENVKMKKMFRDIISAYIGVEPVFINSADFSAQNRRRYYWMNWNIDNITPSNVLLSDILETGTIDSKYYLSDDQIKTCIQKYKSKVYPSGNRMGNMQFPDEILRKAKTVCSVQIPGRETHLIKVSACSTGVVHSGGNHSDMDLFLSNKGDLRRLTPIECERLQTLPDNYTNTVSDSQRYKILGNGWTGDVIAHIFKSLIK